MLQKVLLALALAADVPVLLLDEPTANLDARARQDFLHGLERVAHDTTILLATHRLSDVEAVADRLLVLHGGGIAFDGSMAQLHDRIGATQTLWLRVPPGARELAQGHVQRRFGLPSFVSNGSAFGVRVARRARMDLLAGLRDDGITVDDFWTESPPLSDLLTGILQLDVAASSSPGPREREV
jgi:ABC-type multidrug transport system ATPase subunit